MGIFQKFFGKTVKAEINYDLIPTEFTNQVLKATIAYNEYGGYCVPLASQQRPLCQKVLKGEVFEPDTIEYMTKNAGDGDIIHAGTFFGDFLPALSRSLADGKHVWAFEPNIENYRCAQVTMALNDIKNVHLIHAGLGAAASTSEVLVKTKNGKSLGGRSKIIDDVSNENVTEEVKIVALDEVIPKDRRISILQLDVEGSEEKALTGGMELIKRCKPLLILEDDYGVTESKWFKDNILDMGYKISSSLHYNKLVIPMD